MGAGPLTEAIQAEKKLDWRDALFTVEVAETPFLALLKTGKKPVQVEANWPAYVRDEQPTVGLPDNTPVSAYNNQNRVSLKSVSQWVRDTWKVSHFAELTESWGVKDEAAFQKKESLLRLRLQVERLLLSTQDCAREGVAGATANLTRGVGRWLEPDAADLNAQYPIPDGLRVASAGVYASTLALFTDTAMETQLVAMADQRKRPVTLDLFAGALLKSGMDDWTQHDPHVTSTNGAIRVYNAQAKDKTYLRQVDFFTFSTGTVRSHMNYNLLYDLATGAATANSSRSGFLLDMDNGWELRFMKGMTHLDLAKDGSGTAGAWDVTLMLACMIPAGQGFINIAS